MPYSPEKRREYYLKRDPDKKRQRDREFEQHRRQRPETHKQWRQEYYLKRDPEKKKHRDREFDQRRQGQRWAYRIFHNYGLTENEYNNMLEEQQYGCKICSRPIQLERHGKLVVDHIKGTKVVRGLLCHGCNKGLGCFKENTLALSNAIEYLRCQPLTP